MNIINAKYTVLSRYFLIIAIVLISSTIAQAAEPEGWIDQQAELVSSEDAALMIEQREQALLDQRTQQAKKQTQLASESFSLSVADAPISTAMAMTASAEYSQLAKALENDPLRIYQFIRNHFKYEPYYGALKGPFLTLKERSGNDFDQAALLVELLRAAGYIANYQYGSMDIPVTATDNLDMAHWLGAEAVADNLIMRTILGSGGIPATLINNTFFRMDRVWVIVDVNGTTYALDPAFKPSSKHS